MTDVIRTSDERVCDARADTGACHHQGLPGFGPNVCPKENNDDDKRASGTHAPAETVGDGASDKKANTSLHGVGSQGSRVNAVDLTSNGNDECDGFGTIYDVTPGEAARRCPGCRMCACPAKPDDELIRRVCLGGMRTIKEGRQIITYLRWLERKHAHETYERRLAEACERMRRAAALVAMAGDQSMALAIYDQSRRLLGDVKPWWDSENTPKAGV